MDSNQKSHILQDATKKQIMTQAQQLDIYDCFNMLTGPEMLSVIEEHQPPHRERIYTPTVTLSAFIAQALNSDRSCQKAVNDHAIKRLCNGLRPCSTTTSSYCEARRRLPTTLISTLATHTGKLLDRYVPTHWQWRRRNVKLVDGTSVSMPDTEENQRDYPQQSGQKPGLGFPIARLVGVVSLSSGSILDAKLGPHQGKGAGEHSLLRELLGAFDPGDIMLGDRYYCSYFLIASLIARGVDVVSQQHVARYTDFRKGTRLGTRDHLVEWIKPQQRPQWMSLEQYHDFPDKLHLREVKVRNKILVTTMLSNKEVHKHALGKLYESRWHVELDLRNIKTTLGMDILSCKTPEMVEKEMWIYFLAYNLIRLLMAQAAFEYDLLPRQISFKHTVQLWLAWTVNASNNNDDAKKVFLFELIASQQVGDRPGRLEPRAVKRRPKTHPLLTKPRTEAREDIRKYGHPKKM